ncbi:MAG: helix-turn-helix transcriptional regulator [Marivibrio sp.]|uniref:helix-turn-helix domain-containing protein n=1 Tax=Marivibrio sp. TaxID=2039719 RepID=UPI0032EB3747
MNKYAQSGVRQSTVVDKFVGARIRARRKQLGMTQAQLGAAVDLSFKQIRKYEHGENRVSASKLLHLASVLGVAVDYFFDGLDGREDALEAPHLEGEALAKEFQAIATASRRRAFLRLVRSIAESPALQESWRRNG